MGLAWVKESNVDNVYWMINKNHWDKTPDVRLCLLSTITKRWMRGDPKRGTYGLKYNSPIYASRLWSMIYVLDSFNIWLFWSRLCDTHYPDFLLAEFGLLFGNNTFMTSALGFITAAGWPPTWEHSTTLHGSSFSIPGLHPKITFS